MSKNMTNRDRAFRAFLVTPAAVVVGALLGPVTAVAIVLYALAGVMLATGAVGFCPLYALFHVDSRGRRPLPH